jgi:acyl-CoA reductase-like NAD-dependent aldehyde dehydrogenase
MTMTMTMTIDGEQVSGTQRFDVLNPANEEILGDAPECTEDELNAAVAAAERAFKHWRQDVNLRRSVLLECAARIRANQKELARLLTQEQGKPLPKAMGEIGGTARWFEYTAELEIPKTTIELDGQDSVEVHRRPMGVVAAIIPWNYPVITAAWKIAPALLTGNTVVLKPSPYTPLATLRLGELLNDLIPKGVLNIVSGGDTLGEMLCSHPSVRKISFTGSTAAGKSVAMSAASDLKRLTLELGGNDPAIILPGTDPKTIANKLFTAAFENSGQVCVAIKRVLVPEDIYDETIDELASIAKGIKLGNGLDEGTDLGPVNNRRQFERVLELVEDAKRNGGKVAVGGKRYGDKGFFVEPAIVSELGDDARLVAEEQFGPALPIQSYREIDEVIDRANAGKFGLAASVWGPDKQRAAEIAQQLDYGLVWVNQHLNIAPQVPIAGMKWSGIGVENGPWGLIQYTDLQVIEVAQG